MRTLKVKISLVYEFLQLSSVAQLCPVLCDPMDCSTPGFPVYPQLLELAQTHVHRVGDAIQPAHPLLSPSPSVAIVKEIASLINFSAPGF